MTAPRPAAPRTPRAARRACEKAPRPASPARALRSRPGSALIERSHDPRAGGPRHDRPGTPDPKLLAFARWFADWWLRRGRDLTDRRTVADSRQRAAAYVRESTEEQGQGFSPDAQRQAIARFAAENDLELIGEYCDFHSGWRKSEARPEFQRLMADAAEGKLRRRARLPHLAVRPKPGRGAPLQAAPARAARHPRHLRHPADGRRPHRPLRVPRRVDPRDVRRVLLRLALLLDAQRACARRRARATSSARSPGATYATPTRKLATPDPERAPLVLELFERYATGQESDRTLAAWLNAKGARTARDRPFGKDTVRRDALQRRVRRLRHRAAQQEPLDPRAARADRPRGAVRPRAGSPRLAHHASSNPGRPPRSTCCASCCAASAAARGCTARAARRPRVRRYMCSTRRYGALLRRADHHGRSRSRRSSSTGYAPSSPTGELLDAPARNAAHRAPHAHRAAAPAPRRAARPATAPARPLRDRRPHQSRSTSCAARRSRKSSSASARPPTPPSTAPARSSATSRASGTWRPTPPSGASSCSPCSSRCGRTNGQIVAVQPHDAFLPYFDAADETLQHRCENIGAEGGSDGTRTRDLRRDRPAL